MLFSKSCRVVLFFAYLLSANAETVRGVQQRELADTKPANVELGTAGNYAILTKAGISTVPDSVITGNIAVSPIAATAITGFSLALAVDGKSSTSLQISSGMAYGASYIAPTPADLTVAIGDIGTAYTDAASRLNPHPNKINLGGGSIGGLTLSQTTDGVDDNNGVYTFGSGVTINSDVTFDGSAEDIFIIQMTGNLLVAANVNVILTGGVLAKNIFWQVTGNVKVMAGAHMEGILLVKTDVLFVTGSSLNGRVLAQSACALQMATITEPLDPFDYPAKLPPPPEMFVEGFIIRLVKQISRYETPIQIWLAHRIDETCWNCIAHYHPTALNAITKVDPVPRAPLEYHTSEARALCMTFALNKLVPEILPSAAELFSDWLDEVGLDSSILSDADAKDRAEGVEGDRSPHVIGSLVAAEMLQDIESDGWNYKGISKPNNGTCTANCRPFADSYGYEPKNNPWEISDDTKWQPLIESDDLGFYYPQEHVTPHIGFKAKPMVLTRDQLDARKLDDPMYDYAAETLKAIENVANIDDEKEGLINFFNSKLNIAAGLMFRIRGTYRMSLEAQVFFMLGYTAAEHDAVLLAWKEKIRHDRIRPTSRVQALGDLEVTSFAGTHKAADWVPFVRVMPHAEYPSGSGCLCIALSQYVDAFLSNQYNQASIETSWKINGQTITFAKLSDLKNTCGKTRLSGGMHFAASVPDSYELCDGVGTTGYTGYVAPLLGNGSYDELMDDTKPKYSGEYFNSQYIKT